MKTRNKHLINLTLSAMFLAIGLLLPLITGQIKQIGQMLLPMHIPVMLCGLICGWKWGTAVGFVMPLMRNLIFGMPPMPNAVSMAFELATYGFVIGFLYNHSRWKCIFSLYRSMLAAMIAGRVVWGAVQALIMGVSGSEFTFSMFMAGAFLDAFPGIILQLILIPAIMLLLNRTGLVTFTKKKSDRRADL